MNGIHATSKGVYRQGCRDPNHPGRQVLGLLPLADTKATRLEVARHDQDANFSW